MNKPPAYIFSFPLDESHEPAAICIGPLDDIACKHPPTIVDALARTLDNAVDALEILQLAAGIEAFGGTLTASQPAPLGSTQKVMQRPLGVPQLASSRQ